MNNFRSRFAVFALLGALGTAAGTAQDNAWVPRGPFDTGFVSAVAVTGSTALAATDNGIYRSSDGGRTWHPSGFAGQTVWSVEAAPGASIVFASAPTMDFTAWVHYTSEDAGLTWAPVAGLPPLNLIAIDRWHPTTVYAGAADEATIFRSTDSGRTWHPLPTVPFPDDRARGFEFDGLAIYVFSFDHQESAYKYSRSSDGGASWSEVQPPLSYVFPLGTGAEPGVVYAVGAAKVCRSIDSAATWTCASGRPPRSANQILEVPGESTRLLAFSYEGLYASTDHGATWTPAIGDLGSAYLTSLSFDASGSIALAGTAKGVHRSEDGGELWTSSSSGIRSASVYSLVADPNDSSTVWADTGFLGTSGPHLFRSSDDGFSWSSSGGPGAWIAEGSFAIDPERSSTLYAGGSAVYRSDDSGATWSASSPFGLYVEALAVDPHSPRRVLAGSYFGLARSEDGASTWTGAGLAQHVYSILFDSRTPGKVYAGSYFDVEPGFYGYPFGGALFVSPDAGASFSKVERDFGSPVNAIVDDPFEDRVLYVGTESHGVFRSVDDGANWEGPSPPGVEIGTLSALVADPVRRGRLYASSDLGVFVTSDGARTWQTFSAGLAPFRVSPLAISGDGQWLHVGTLGGGVFSTDLATNYPCTPSATRLCLVQGRYEVKLRESLDDEDSPARPLGDRAGYFGSELPDVVVKMLRDGTFGPGGAPFFYSSLTTTSFVITVTDTLTGLETTYRSHDDAPYCGGVDLAFVRAEGAALRRDIAASGPTTLTLLGGRFVVSVTARRPSGPENENGLVMVSDDRFGIFSLPAFTGDPDFPEVVVEMVDSGAGSGNFQLSYTGLTSLDYTLTVTDTLTGAVRTYVNVTPFCGAMEPVEEPTTPTIPTDLNGFWWGTLHYASDCQSHCGSRENVTAILSHAGSVVTGVLYTGCLGDIALNGTLEGSQLTLGYSPSNLVGAATPTHMRLEANCDPWGYGTDNVMRLDLDRSP